MVREEAIPYGLEYYLGLKFETGDELMGIDEGDEDDDDDEDDEPK